jgi:DUF4097 and DUF4098 domain-containing protein YvlB
MKTIARYHWRGFCRGFTPIAVLMIAAGCIYVNDSSFSGGGLPAVADRTRSGQIPADLKTLEVENRFGIVRVIAVEGEPAQWSWRLTVRAKTDALAQQWADAADCLAEQDGDRLRLALELPHSVRDASFQSDFEIRVPRSVAVRSHNAFGRTTISGVAGDVEATGQNGAVELHDIGGKVRAGASFGSLTVRNVGPAVLKDQNGRVEAADVHGPLDVETSFGTLTAHNIDGAIKARNQNGKIEVTQGKGNASLETSFAELRAEGIDGDATLANQNGSVFARDITGSVNARTSFAKMDVECSGRELLCQNQNGSLELRATSTELVRLEAKTAFGSLEVRLPAGLKPAIQARTSFADIESDFPILMKPRGQDAFSDVEPGTPRILLQNQNGRIRIVRDRSAASR